MADLMSRPFRPQMACERCVFGTGEHAADCEWLDNMRVAFDAAYVALCPKLDVFIDRLNKRDKRPKLGDSLYAR